MRVRLLAASRAAPPADTDWLSDAEAARAAAMRSPPRRQQFLAGHWQARCFAADVFGGRPGDWTWQGSAGAATLRRPEGEALQVSLSHSGDWLALALSAQRVGIDVEQPRRERDWLALATFALAPEEAGEVALAGMPADVFHRYWTLKEAEGKRSGLGLLPGRSRGLAARPAAPAVAEAWYWHVGEGLHLAVAGTPGQVPVVEGLPGAAPARAYRFHAGDA